MREKLLSIIAHYGKDAQTLKAAEELSELLEKVTKLSTKDRYDIEELSGEIADVYIMLLQLMLMYHIRPEDMDDVIEGKLNRTLDAIGIEKRYYTIEGWIGDEADN